MIQFLFSPHNTQINRHNPPPTKRNTTFESRSLLFVSICSTIYLLDIGNGPGLKCAPPEPFVISRHNGSKSQNEHVGKSIFLTSIGLGFGTPNKQQP